MWSFAFFLLHDSVVVVVCLSMLYSGRRASYRLSTLILALAIVAQSVRCQVSFAPCELLTANVILQQGLDQPPVVALLSRQSRKQVLGDRVLHSAIALLDAVLDVAKVVGDHCLRRAVVEQALL